MEAYRLYTVVPRLVDFINLLTNGYVRLNRGRCKCVGGNTEEAFVSLSVLYECLLTLCRLMSPFTPFFTEYLYQNLRRIHPVPTNILSLYSVEPQQPRRPDRLRGSFRVHPLRHAPRDRRVRLLRRPRDSSPDASSDDGDRDGSCAARAKDHLPEAPRAQHRHRLLRPRGPQRHQVARELFNGGAELPRGALRDQRGQLVPVQHLAGVQRAGPPSGQELQGGDAGAGAVHGGGREEAGAGAQADGGRVRAERGGAGREARVPLREPAVRGRRGGGPLVHRGDRHDAGRGDSGAGHRARVHQPRAEDAKGGRAGPQRPH